MIKLIKENENRMFDDIVYKVAGYMLRNEQYSYEELLEEFEDLSKRQYEDALFLIGIGA